MFMKVSRLSNLEQKLLIITIQVGYERHGIWHENCSQGPMSTGYVLANPTYRMAVAGEMEEG